MKPTQPPFPKLPYLETEEEARAEDLLRGKAILENRENIPASSRDHATTLGYQLIVSGEGGDVPATPASSAHMRVVRGQIATALLEVSHRYDQEDQRCFTIVRSCFRTTIDALERRTSLILLSRLRAQLSDYRADGLLFGGFHLEEDPNSGIAQPHFHGFACGEMVDVLEALRGRPSYCRDHYVAQPIRVVRIGDPARQIPYTLQSWHPSRWIGPVGEEGSIRRSRQKRRIPEPHHTLLLLWLDTQSLSSLTLVMGARLTSTGLVPHKLAL